MQVGAPDFPYDIFISYSHADQQWVRDWLVPRLKEAGLSVCVDYEKFDVGVPSLTNMERAVEQSRKTVLVLTPNWTESDWANFESLLAQTDDPVGRLRRILPLMLNRCTPRKGISIFTYADFTDPERWDGAFASLVHAVRDEYHLKPSIDVPRFTASYRIPFILPQLDVPTFSGREEELTRLADLLLKRGGSKVCSIAGLAGAGGIGKSALACHFADLHREDFPDGVVGLRVDGKDVDALAREFVRHVGEEIDPEDERDAAAIMQDVFGRRRALLIFDNAEDAGVAALRPGGTTCAVIVTTRDRQLPSLIGIPEEGRLDLSPLPHADALLLLERLIGKDRIAACPAAADEIVELVGRLPLALQIVGATLQVQVWRGLDDYAATLRAERERLSRLQIRGAAHLDVRASFSLSLKLLTDDEVDFFACLSVCAQDGFSARAATAATGCVEDAAHERLGHLFRLSLLNLHQSGAGRFVFHPLLRLFAQELATERSLRDAAAERHAHHYVELVKSCAEGDAAAGALIAAELDDIIVAAEWLQSHDKPDYEFVISLEPFLENNGYWRQAVDLMSGFLRLAEHMEDWRAVVQLRIQRAKFLALHGEWGQAEVALLPVEGILERIESLYTRARLELMWLNTIGGIQQRQGRFDKALVSLQRSRVVCAELGERRSLAIVLNSLGSVLQRMGRFNEAADALERSRAISEELGDNRSLVMVLTSLGGVQQRLGHFHEAAETLRRAAVLEEHSGNRRGLAKVLNSLGGVLQRLGKFDDAVGVLRRCVPIEKEIGNRRGQAMVLNSLGSVLQRQGLFGEAVAAFRDCAGLLVELGDFRGQAMALTSLGGALQRQGHFEEAATVLRQSIAVEEKLENQRGLAMALNSLGGVLQRMRRFDEAADVLHRSIGVEEQLKNQVGLAMVLNSLGRVLQRLGHLDEAEEALRRSVRIGEELDDERHVAMALNSLGGVLQRTGQFEEALASFHRGIEIQERLKDHLGVGMLRASLGRAWLSQGESEKGIAELRQAFSINEGLKNSQGVAIVGPTLIRALMGIGSGEEALLYCERALVVAPESRHLMSIRKELRAARGGATEIIQGTVKRNLILHAKGYRYGFISPDDGSLDVYFREAAADSVPPGKLRGGLRVEAEVGPGHKGREAKKVRMLPE